MLGGSGGVNTVEIDNKTLLDAKDCVRRLIQVTAKVECAGRLAQVSPRKLPITNVRYLIMDVEVEPT